MKYKYDTENTDKNTHLNIFTQLKHKFKKYLRFSTTNIDQQRSISYPNMSLHYSIILNDLDSIKNRKIQHYNNVPCDTHLHTINELKLFLK